MPRDKDKKKKITPSILGSRGGQKKVGKGLDVGGFVKSEIGKRGDTPRIGSSQGGGFQPGPMRDIAEALSGPSRAVKGSTVAGEGLNLADAAKRRIADERSSLQGFMSQTGAPPSSMNPGEDDLAAALSYLEERQALAGLNEMQRFGGMGPGASQPAPGGGVEGATQGLSTSANSQVSDLPDFVRNTPLGRKVERDGWDLSPEDERALQMIIADRLRNAGSAGL